MTDWTVRPWARPHLEEDEPKNVTPKLDRAKLRELMAELRAGYDARRALATRKSYTSLLIAAALFVVCRAPGLPSWIHWTAFIASAVAGSISMWAWWDAVTLRKILEITPIIE
ncbi:MAG: hypothetical protein KGL39_32945 [Patescibacteria group bacterium]|nr:hypothetical protein [Patescibacteria group bacterium]